MPPSIKYLQSMIGKQYGDYTVLPIGHKQRRSNVLFQVQCKCKRIAFCTKQELEGGKRNRCDVCGKEKRFGKRIDNISINFFHNYKRGALRRKITFDITYEEAVSLYHQQKGKCALSGVYLKIEGVRFNGTRTASLDRIDSSKGYIKDNVQWVHKDINQMKMTLSDQEFIRWCKLVAKFNINQK